MKKNVKYSYKLIYRNFFKKNDEKLKNNRKNLCYQMFNIYLLYNKLIVYLAKL